MAACLSVLLLGVCAHWEGAGPTKKATAPTLSRPRRPFSLALDMPSRLCTCVCVCARARVHTHMGVCVRVRTHMGVSTAVRAELGLTVRSRHSLVGTGSSGPTKVPEVGKG